MSRRAAAPARSAEPHRAAYLAEVLETLYPAVGGGDRYAEFLVLPHLRRPRLLVPAGQRRAAAAALRHREPPRSWPVRVARRAGATALRTGAGTLLADRVRVGAAGSIEAHLRDLVGIPVSLGIRIGPARANRKPVLQLLTPSGLTVGFAKVGTSPLTNTLVAAEAAALAALGRCRLPSLTVPQLRHTGRWRTSHRLLVQSALPVWRARPAPSPVRPAPPGTGPDRVTDAMRELAYCLGTSAGPLAGSGYWRQLRTRVLGARTAATGPEAAHEAAVLAAAAAEIAVRAGGVDLRYGVWHGDWAPWNMVALPETLLVWDWERFQSGVPVGFDALHYDLQCRLLRAADPARAVAGTLATAGRLLAPFDVPPPARRPTALLYLVDLAARYLTDRQAEAGARLGVLGTWLLPALLSQLAHLEVHP